MDMKDPSATPLDPLDRSLRLVLSPSSLCVFTGGRSQSHREFTFAAASLLSGEFKEK